MATIVVQRQPKQQNNIWEQAAVNLIGGLITDAIQRGRETTQNRKMNIAMGEWANALANNAPTTTNYMQGIGTVPEGYNSNGWANAAHQSYSPLEQFNMGTADLELTPLQTANQQQPQQTYVPTMADAQKAWSTILANPRFSMLNRENADKLMTNYFNTVQQNYDRSRREKAAETIANITDPQARYNAVLNGIYQGVLPGDLAQPAYQAYSHIVPTTQQMLENQLKQDELDYKYYEHDNLSALDILKDNTERYKWDNPSGSDILTNNYNYYKTDIERDLKQQEIDEIKRQGDEAIRKGEYERSTGKYATVEAEDGSVIYYDKTTMQAEYVRDKNGNLVHIASKDKKEIKQLADGTYILLDPKTGKWSTVTDKNGNSAKGALTNTWINNDLTKSQQAQLKILQEDRKQKMKELQEAQSMLKYFNTPEEKAEVERLTKELEENYAAIMAITGGYAPTQGQNNTNITSPNGTNNEMNATMNRISVPSGPNPTKSAIIHYDIPDEVFYDPSRDGNLPKDKLMSVEYLQKWLKYTLNSPQFAGFTPQDLVNNLYKRGFRITGEGATKAGKGTARKNPISADVGVQVPNSVGNGDMTSPVQSRDTVSVSSDISPASVDLTPLTTVPTSSDVASPDVTVTSGDINNVSSDVSPINNGMAYDPMDSRNWTASLNGGGQIPQSQQQISYTQDVNSIPQYLVYTPNRDQYVDPAKVGTPEQLDEYIRFWKARNPRYTDEFLTRFLASEGFRINTVPDRFIWDGILAEPQYPEKTNESEYQWDGVLAEPQYPEYQWDGVLAEPQYPNSEYPNLDTNSFDKSDMRILPYYYTPYEVKARERMTDKEFNDYMWHKHTKPIPNANPNEPIEFQLLNNNSQRYDPMDRANWIASRNRMNRRRRPVVRRPQNIELTPLSTEDMRAANNRVRQIVGGEKVLSRGYPKYKSIVEQTASKYNVEPELISAIIQAESAWNPNAKSPAGARGLMQLMPATAKGLGVKNSGDPTQNIEGGTKYFARLLKQYGGNIRKALWGYNAGAGNVKKGRLPEETQKYIPRVLSIYNKLKANKRR